MKEKLVALATALSLAFLANPAKAVTFTPDLGGGDGEVIDLDPGAFQFAFTIVSSNHGLEDQLTKAVATAGPKPIRVSGVWNFSTQDVDGSSFDPFGFFIGSELTQLSTDGLLPPAFHNGSFLFNVAAGETFGFYALSTDGEAGRSSTSVFVNVSAIPLPAAGLLLLSALGGLHLLRRREERAA